MSNYSKLIAAVVGLLVIVLGPGFIGIGDGLTVFGIDATVIVQGILAVLTALGVFAVPNTPTE
jgi:hypothetical protein